MSITFTPLHPVFAAECSGVDIGEPISRDTAAAIEDAMDRYAVLVFRRGAPLTTQQQIAFTRSLGELEAPYRKINAEAGVRLDNPALSDISNLAPGDKILSRDDRKRLFNVIGNRSGTATAATRQSLRGTRCFARTSFRPKAAIPSSRICAQRGMRSNHGSRKR